MTRVSWDKYYMDITWAASKRSTCPRLAVGAIIVKDNKIISTGFNGSLHGEGHCEDVGCLVVNGHCIRTIHAEMNSIFRAEQCLKGCTIYVTHSCCIDCYKAIHQVGISKIIYDVEYKLIDYPKILQLDWYPEIVKLT